MLLDSLRERYFLLIICFLCLKIGKKATEETSEKIEKAESTKSEKSKTEKPKSEKKSPEKPKTDKKSTETTHIDEKSKDGTESVKEDGKLGILFKMKSCMCWSLQIVITRC